MDDKKIDLPEAPFVVWTTAENDGWTWNITLRKGMTPKDVDGMFSLIKTAQDKGVELGYTYKEKTFGGRKKYQPEYVEGRTCPTCNEKLIYSKKKDGTKFIKCSTNKWNKFKMQAEGCPFIEWPDQKRTTQKVEGGTVSQVEDNIPDPTEDW